MREGGESHLKKFSYYRTFIPILLQKGTLRQLQRHTDRHTLYSKAAGQKREKEKQGQGDETELRLELMENLLPKGLCSAVG